MAPLVSILIGHLRPKPKRDLKGLCPVLIVELDGDHIAMARVIDPIKQRPLIRSVWERHAELVIGDLSDAEIKQRFGVSPRERGQILQQLPGWPKQGQHKVALISLEPDKPVLARVRRKMSFDDLTLDTSFSGDQTSQGWGKKKTASSLHESTFRAGSCWSLMSIVG